MESRKVDLEGPVHYADFGGEGRPIVCVHGLGGSHLNWLAVAPALARRGRVLAPDLAGFGFTPPAGRSSGVEANRALLDRFLGEVVREPAILVGNSMGGLLAMLEAAASPERVAGLVLVNPAQPRPPLAPIDPAAGLRFFLAVLPGGRFLLRRRQARLGAAGVVASIFDSCCVDRTRIPVAVYDAHVAFAAERLATMPWSDAAFTEALRSLLSVTARRARFRETVASIRAPALLVHGTRDRLIPIDASRELARQRPDWTLEEHPEVGHVPQLEDPARFLEVVERWLDARFPAASATRA